MIEYWNLLPIQGVNGSHYWNDVHGNCAIAITLLKFQGHFKRETKKSCINNINKILVSCKEIMDIKIVWWYYGIKQSIITLLYNSCILISLCCWNMYSTNSIISSQ